MMKATVCFALLLVGCAYALSPFLHEIVLKAGDKEGDHIARINKAFDFLESHPRATSHQAEINHKGHMKVSDHDDDDDDDDDHDGPAHSGNELKRLGREYLELQANNTRTLNGALRLYRTAMIDQCGQYLSALQHGDANLTDLISPIVTPDAAGRIHPLGFFDSPVSLIEYFMLACFGNSAVTKETFTKIVVVNDLVMFNIVFCLQPPSNLNAPCSNLTHVGWAKVAADGRVRALKVLFQRLGFPDAVLPPFAQEAQVHNVRAATMNAICGIIQTRCTGANQQYADLAACNAYMQSIPDGGWERGDQKDFGCVRLHQILTGSRPDVHCAHVGPTGGGKCTPHSLQSFYDTDDFLNAL
jgi:hypothetical protein